MSSAPVKRGQFLVIGLSVPKNGSDGDAILDDLRPSDEGAARELEMRYAAVRIPNRGCRIGAWRGWPPLGCRRKMHLVAGFRVPRGSVGALLLVGARSRSVGSWSIPGFRLRYHVGSHRFETTYRQGIGIRVVPRGSWMRSSAPFSSFETQERNIACAYLRASRSLQCGVRGEATCGGGWSGYEMTVDGEPRSACVVRRREAAVLRAGRQWRYHGFLCYAWRDRVRCRNQVFEGFFLGERRSRHT